MTSALLLEFSLSQPGDLNDLAVGGEGAVYRVKLGQLFTIPLC